MANEGDGRHELAPDDLRAMSRSLRTRKLLEPERDRRRRTGTQLSVCRPGRRQLQPDREPCAGWREAQAPSDGIHRIEFLGKHCCVQPKIVVRCPQCTFEVDHRAGPADAVLSSVQRPGRQREGPRRMPGDHDDVGVRGARAPRRRGVRAHPRQPGAGRSSTRRCRAATRWHARATTTACRDRRNAARGPAIRGPPPRPRDRAGRSADRSRRRRAARLLNRASSRSTDPSAAGPRHRRDRSCEAARPSPHRAAACWLSPPASRRCLGAQVSPPSKSVRRPAVPR